MSDLGPQATLTPATAENPGRVTGGTAAQQLALAKAYLAQLQSKYSDTWPDVKAWKRIVQEAQEKADAEALSRPVTLGDSGLPPAEAARRAKIQQARTQIDLLDRQIAARQAEDARLRKEALAPESSGSTRRPSAILR